MATLRSQLVLTLRDRVSGPARGVGAAMGRLTRQANNFGASQMAVGGVALRTVRNLAIMGAGYVGVTRGIGGAVRGAMAFETAMADLAKKSTLTDAQLAQMRDRITDLSNSMPLTKVEIAGLIAQAAQFGIASEELERFALAGAKAAVAFDMDPRQAAESLSQLKNAFALDMTGLEALADAINYTADSAGTSEESVIDFLTRTAATAKTFGVSAQELAAFGATMNEIGISSQVAATGMRAMMTKMSALTDNGDVVEILDAIGGQGYSERLQRQFYEAPVEAMQEMFRVAQQMSTEQRAGFFLEMFGMEYGDDAAAIANNIDTINRRLVELGDASNYAGSVDKTYEIFSATTEQRLKVLSNNINNIGSALGAKMLGPIVEFSDALVNVLGTLDERVTIFDEIGRAMDGFRNGLGLKPGQGLADLFGSGWDAIFGDAAKFEEDTDNLARIFMRFQEMGASVRAFGNDIAEFTAKMEGLLGLDAGTIGETLGTVAKYGFLMWAAAAPIRMVAGAIRGLARALFVLSGASMIFGGAKGIRDLFRALRGAGALAGAAASGTGAAAGGAAAGAGAARPSLLRRLAVRAAPLAAIPVLGSGTRIEGNETRTTTGLFDRFQEMRAQDGSMDGLQQRAEQLRQKIAELSTEIESTPDNLISPVAVTELAFAQAELANVEAAIQQLRDEAENPISPQVDTSSINSATQQVNALTQGLRNLSELSTRPSVGGSVPIDGARASGGPVNRGGLYLVGERGPELFRAPASGSVIDAAATRSIMSRAGEAGRGAIRDINLSFGNIIVPQAGASVRDIARDLGDAVAAELRGTFADWA